MKVNMKQDGANTLLEMEGRLDTITSQNFQKELMDAIAADGNTILDMAEIVYVSSAGLRALLTGHKAAMAKGAEMILRNVQLEVMEVFEMTGFDELLNIEK